MSEQESHLLFKRYLFQQRFRQAAEILVMYCQLNSAVQIEAILVAAYIVQGRRLDFRLIKGPGKNSVKRAVELLKQSPPVIRNKEERHKHNLSLMPHDRKDGKHKQRQKKVK